MKPAQHIVSFLPSATEIACALGLSDQLVGITHECDYPEDVMGKPIVVRNALPIETMSQQEIDQAVAQRMKEGRSLYEIDEVLLQSLAPDLILTQDLCQVCAPSGNEVSQALNLLPKKPQILWLTPNSLEQIMENVQDLGEATGRAREAHELIAGGRARLEAIAAVTRGLSNRPRVFCMEWIDPVYSSGHWVPEMVSIAGGRDELSRERSDSIRLAWEDVVKWAPEIMIIMPCGFNLVKALEQVGPLAHYPGWLDIPAVRGGRVYVVDANSFFARPGPRVVDGTELLAHLIHPELFEWKGRAGAYQRLSM
jgi:iron complex transport system substrate-binding protein